MRSMHHKTVDKIVEDADEKLVRNTIYNKLHVRSFVSSGAAVDCWQSFDVPSATASAEA